MASGMMIGVVDPKIKDQNLKEEEAIRMKARTPRALQTDHLGDALEGFRRIFGGQEQEQQESGETERTRSDSSSSSVVSSSEGDISSPASMRSVDSPLASTTMLASSPPASSSKVVLPESVGGELTDDRIKQRL